MSLRLAARSLAAVAAMLLLVVACREIVAPDGALDVSGAASLLNPAGRVVVHASNMKSWVFYNDQNGTACSGSNCQLADGPAGQPGGSGSAELAVVATSEGKALILPDYKGIRFDRLTSLSYSTYRQTSDVGNNLAIALQFNVDYDLDDTSTGYQGRLVFEPYMGVGGNVSAQTWQSWDTKAGRWWGTRTVVTVNNATVPNSCVQSAPCTWNQLLAAFARVGVHNVYGAVVLKAGSGWSNFRGNIDNLTIGVDGVETTFDFELSAPPAVPATAPNTPPWALLDPSRVLMSPDSLQIPVFADLIEVEFVEGTPLAEREAAIGSVSGTVVGGFDTGDVEDTYSVLLPTDPSGKTMRDAVLSLKTRPSVRRARVELAVTNALSYRRPNDGAGLKRADWKLDPNDAFVGADTTWAASAVSAPHAWGCSSGANVLLATIDMGHAYNPEFAGRINPASVLRPAEASPDLSHGQAVASVAAASSDNGIGIAGIAPATLLLLLDVGAVDSTTKRLKPDTLGQATVVDGFFFEAWHAIRLERPRVINVSLGATTAPSPATDTLYRDIVSQMKSDVESDNRWDPLFVIAAGNAGPSARHDWGFLGSLRDSMPTRVLIVGAAARQLNTAYALTSTGGIVDIYAPGVRVATDSANAISFREGTSFAAPLVAGAAALLFSFDPRLTAAEVRGLLLQGATPARNVVGKPFLDAYGSLRAASDSSGAPLCGNRVWADAQNRFFAQRSPSGTPEQLLTVSNESFDATYANIHHGGRRIEFAFGIRFIWTAMGWTAGTWSNDDTKEYSGAFKGSGAYFQDHDDTFYSHVDASWSGGAVTFNVALTGLVPGFTTRTVVSGPVALPLLAAPLTCIRETRVDSLNPWECASEAMDGTYHILSQWNNSDAGTVHAHPNALHALDPQGRFIVVPLPVRQTTIQYSTTWGSCTSPSPNLRCRPISRIGDVTSVRTLLVRIDLSTGTATSLSTPSLITTGVGDEVFWLAIDERGQELAIQVGGITLGSLGLGCARGRHEWLAIPSGASVNAPSTHSVSISGTAVCNGEVDGSGSSALRMLP